MDVLTSETLRFHAKQASPAVISTAEWWAKGGNACDTVLQIDCERLTERIVQAIDKARYQRALQQVQVIVGRDVLAECLTKPQDIPADFYQEQIEYKGNPVQLVGWAEGILVLPLKGNAREIM